jgi:hypothetical protein
MTLVDVHTKGDPPVDNPKKASERFPLRLPADLDAEIRAIARGDGTNPPSGINDTIVFLLREALKARKEKRETEPGNWLPAPLQPVQAP